MTKGQKIQIMGQIEAIVQDKDGRVLEAKTFRMDSWVDNFAWIFHLVVNMFTSASQPKTTAGVTPGYIATNGVVPAVAGAIDQGIVIGTGDDAFDHAQYALVTPITHGSDAGKMLFSPSVLVAPTWSATKWTMSQQRVFNNVSGASISVKEMAIYLKDGAFGSIIMMCRDVPAPLAVPNLGTLTVTYSFEITA